MHLTRCTISSIANRKPDILITTNNKTTKIQPIKKELASLFDYKSTKALATDGKKLFISTYLHYQTTPTRDLSLLRISD